MSTPTTRRDAAARDPATVLLCGGRRHWPQVRALLLDAGLPPDGAEEHLDDFLLLLRDGRVEAVVGAEVYGRNALLRSAVVPVPLRGRGTGRALVIQLLAQLRARGVGDVWLLTTTAERFFAGLGFAPADRDHAPAAIRASAQFRGACPDTATLMRRQA